MRLLVVRQMIDAADFPQLVDDACTAGAIQKTGELLPFVEFLAARSLDTVLEVGTATGGTLYVWCWLAPDDATLVSVDLPGGEFGGVGVDDDPYWQERIGGYRRAEQTLELVRGDSHLASTRAEAVRRLAGRPVDLLFIDGDHSFNGVAADFFDYAPLVREGGVVAFHDVLEHDPSVGVGVGRFWRKARVRGWETFEWTAPAYDWGGIGALVFDSAVYVRFAAERERLRFPAHLLG